MAKKKTTKKQAEPTPMTIGQALHACHLNERAAMAAIPYKLKCAFDISLAGTQISFHKDGDYLSHEEAVEAVKLLLELLTGVQNSSKL